MHGIKIPIFVNQSFESHPFTYPLSKEMIHRTQKNCLNKTSINLGGTCVEMSVTESALSMFEGREEGEEGGEGVGKLLEEIVERDGASQVDPVDVMVSIEKEECI